MTAQSGQSDREMPRREPSEFRVDIRPVVAGSVVRDGRAEIETGFSSVMVTSNQQTVILQATVPNEAIPAEVGLAIERWHKLERASVPRP